MCRNNQLVGCSLISFGLGILVGTILKSGFLCCLIGLGMLVLGFCILQKR